VQKLSFRRHLQIPKNKNTKTTVIILVHVVPMSMVQTVVWYTDDIKTNDALVIHNELGGALLEVEVYVDEQSYVRLSAEKVTLDKIENTDLSCAKGIVKIGFATIKKLEKEGRKAQTNKTK